MPIPVTPVAPAPAVPDSSDATATFDAQYEAFNAWEKNNLQPEVNALAIATYANAVSAASAAAAAGAVAWVSGAAYTAGTSVVTSGIDFQAYRRKTTSSAGTTDPSLDGTNWARINLAADAITRTARTSNTILAEADRASLIDINDISYTVPGPLSYLLNMGSVVAETAAQAGKFSFDRVKNPLAVSDEIRRRVEQYYERQRSAENRRRAQEFPVWFEMYERLGTEREGEQF